MSVFAIKILALVTMVIDHSAYYLYSSSLIGFGLYFAMRTAGRIAFPLYAFLLVNGFEKTSNRGKYLSRLVLFAAVSQLPYTIVFSQENYRLSAVSGFALLWPWYIAVLAVLAVCAVWYFCVRRDTSVVSLAAAFMLAVVQLSAGGACLLGFETNVFYTLAVSLAGMSVLAMLVSQRQFRPSTCVPCGVRYLRHMYSSEFGLRLVRFCTDDVPLVLSPLKTASGSCAAALVLCRIRRLYPQLGILCCRSTCSDPGAAV